MDNKTLTSKFYIITSINNHGSEKEYTSDEETDCNQHQQQGEGFNAQLIIKLFHIVKTSIHQTTTKDHPTNMLKINQCYYVDMFRNHTMI
jgi:hypothetical protein